MVEVFKQFDSFGFVCSIGDPLATLEAVGQIFFTLKNEQDTLCEE